MSDWQPTCSLQMLQCRARMLHGVRTFFEQRNYLEVETPLLSHDIVIDAYLEPFQVLLRSQETSTASASRLFLQTSPEAAMKRLLAAGCGSIYQITRSFRRDEIGTRHNPEFTMLEWYGPGTTLDDQLQLTAELVRTAVTAAAADAAAAELLQQPFGVVTYADAFRNLIRGSVLEISAPALADQIRQANLLPDVTELPAERDDLLNLLLAQYVEPQLGFDRPQFLIDYPISQAALAEASASDARVARRFELYVRGVELCNGYQELTDPVELQRRDQQQNRSRSRQGVAELPGAARLNDAMQHGLPACSGVALGFDRLVMLATNSADIRDVIPFPIDRA